MYKKWREPEKIFRHTANYGIGPLEFTEFKLGKVTWNDVDFGETESSVIANCIGPVPYTIDNITTKEIKPMKTYNYEEAKDAKQTFDYDRTNVFCPEIKDYCKTACEAYVKSLSHQVGSENGEDRFTVTKGYCNYAKVFIGE